VALARAGLPAADHWWLPRNRGRGFVLMLPAVVGPHGRAGRPVFLVAVAAVASRSRCWRRDREHPGIIAALVIFFAGFNVLKPSSPRWCRARRRARHGRARSLFERTVPRDVLRRRRRRAMRAARGLPRRARKLPRRDRRVARRRVDMGDFMPAASPACGTYRKDQVMAIGQQVIIVGSVGRDPETRYMPEGGASPTSRWPPPTNGRTEREMQEKTSARVASSASWPRSPAST